jgi:hypothetical protein
MSAWRLAFPKRTIRGSPPPSSTVTKPSHDKATFRSVKNASKLFKTTVGCLKEKFFRQARKRRRTLNAK